MKFHIALITLLLVAATGYCQDCSILKKGKFKYVDNPSAWFVIDGNKHIEYIDDGKYYIESTLKWISNCTYTATVKKTTLPHTDLKPETVLTVTIVKIADGIVSFSSEMNGQKGEGKVRKEE